ncbi:MAG TPA: DoxX family protein [Candidatus Angelobacter sp.]|nr:DoxX family protein [Candidatus Angelobacter sp.]
MNSILRIGDQAYSWFLKMASLMQGPFLLAVRLYWGWQFWQSGSAKLSNISNVVAYFTSLGVPAPALNAHFVSLLEAGGGILLILGLGSRLVALPLAFDMIVAYVTADNEALHSFLSDPEKFRAAAPYTFLFASLLILFFGPGWFSLDTLIAWFRRRRASSFDRSAA